MWIKKRKRGQGLVLSSSSATSSIGALSPVSSTSYGSTQPDGNKLLAETFSLLTELQSVALKHSDDVSLMQSTTDLINDIADWFRDNPMVKSAKAKKAAESTPMADMAGPISALGNLGIKKADAKKAVEFAINNGWKTEADIIRIALKRLAK